MSIDRREVAERVARARAAIAAAGGGDRTKIMAVTKGFGLDAVVAAVAAGCEDIGENYTQETVAKLASGRLVEALAGAPAPRVHFIGHLQSNKVRTLVPVVDVWASIDRLSIGIEVARRAPGARVLVQVNVSGQPQQGGCAPDDTATLVEELRGLGLDVIGLMTIGLAGGDGAARPGFVRLRSLADELGLAERSMGMSDDLVAAVQEGSTMVRLGRALFGPRPRAATTAN